MTYLSSNAILYAENTALFSTIHHVKTSATELITIYLKSIAWLSKGKLALTHTQVNRPVKLFLAQKTRKIYHPSLRFNNRIVF